MDGWMYEHKQMYAQVHRHMCIQNTIAGHAFTKGGMCLSVYLPTHMPSHTTHPPTYEAGREQGRAGGSG